MLTIPAPMHAPERLVRPFTSDDWIYEIKVDGYRRMARAGGGEPTELRRRAAPGLQPSHGLSAAPTADRSPLFQASTSIWPRGLMLIA